MGKTSDRLTPRARAKRDQILAAARGLFLERGFAGTSTDAIAAEAGVSKATLYKHFPSKEGLLADCLRSLVLDLTMDGFLPTDSFHPISSRDELRAALLELADGFVERLMQPDYLELVRVIVNETPRLPQLGDVFRSAVPQTAYRRFNRILERADEGGVASVADADAATRMFVGPLLTYVIGDGLLAREGPTRPPADRVEAIVDLYLRAIVTP